MTKFLVRRTIEMGITLVLASFLLFGILNLAPGGPFDARIASGHVTDPAYIDRLNKMIGLDKPIHERYLTWVSNVLQGSLGESWSIARGLPVSTIIGSRLPNTVMLMTTGLGFSLLIAIAIGTISAVRQYSVFDNVFTAFSFFGISIPAFWFGLIMLKFFGLELKIFPVGGLYSVGKQGDVFDRLWHLVLPMIVISLLSVAQWSRFLRSSLLETLRQDYVRTARAKGQIERIVLFRHAFRNALIPLVTVIALAIPGLFGGAIFTETIFNWPGMGQLLINAVGSSDWPVAMGVVIITAGLTILANFLADVAYVVVDPRIRY
ncbi:MAG TPA: ABC transporter permease [Chloroflexota bacterium]|nr:ABC transporter permease [Chloroflexota bacterium]